MEEKDQQKELEEKKEGAPIKSYELVTDELVSDALKKDKGQDAKLLSWEIKPFTNKGDNYSSLVVGIDTFYQNNEVDSESSYVAKLNPLRPISFQTEFMEMGYITETEMLSTVVEGMNIQLEQLGLDPIKAPKLFSHNLKKGREAFVTENLRIQGFKMYDRMKGMDLNHALFVVKELGKFHASSLLYEKTLPTKFIPDSFIGIQEPWLSMDEEGLDIFRKMYSSSGEAVGKCLINSDPHKYQKCSKWLFKHAHSLLEHFMNGYKGSNDKFEVLIHGDCWTNNMLFKYNVDEIPVDFRFLDLQISAKGPATTDLNYFFFTSLNGDFRRKNFNTLVTAYYGTFSEVWKRAGREPPFSYLELKQELHHRKIYGMASAMLALQFTLAQGEDIPDMELFSGHQADEFIDTQTKSIEKAARREGPFRDRYIAIFDEMLETTSIFDED